MKNCPKAGRMECYHRLYIFCFKDFFRFKHDNLSVYMYSEWTFIQWAS